jgi:GNAT superfamily N-acetyltransferase
MNAFITHIDCLVEEVHERQFIAMDGSRVVGRVGVKAQGSPIAEMRQLFVVPEMRGQGVGKALVAECVRYARINQRATLNLTIAHCNREVIGFYQPLGFMPVYEFTDKEIVMVLPLTCATPATPKQ